MKIGRSGRAASPTSCKKVNSFEDSVFVTAALRGSPTRRCGTSPNLRVVPDVNSWLRLPAPSCGLLPPLHAMGSLSVDEAALLAGLGILLHVFRVFFQSSFPCRRCGTLVLAERLMDGENYPDLHFVDDQNQVTHLTQGSYCWTLNYTQFRGHYIYFGLAGVETRQYGGNPALAERVEAFFPDRTISVSPGNRVIENRDPSERGSRIDNPQGYIMSVPGRDIPENLLVVLNNGEKKSLTEIHVDRSSEYRLDYLKSEQAEVYNSFAFTFTPMLTPGEWDKGYKDG
ncbi:hypothetical protein [Desulfosporosinus sp.]|uniref:hypothetical protein n=1 Tax=Desulfosporosinus sp. TaxID=157907 RepID=UPI0025C11260|nr:hypothetical protein [Desulfosporosinus sp.]MBC2722753.1 hypothetical protein [Desulfosporosinus sp.]MBC2726743.1 hypothetical protein [Desulfosporosinus sp.]